MKHTNPTGGGTTTVLQLSTVQLKSPHSPIPQLCFCKCQLYKPNAYMIFRGRSDLGMP